MLKMGTTKTLIPIPSEVQRTILRTKYNDSSNYRYLLQMHITNLCNIDDVSGAKCGEYCYQRDGKDQEMSFSTFKKVLHEYSPWQIALGGGEPTLHSRFSDFIKYAKQVSHITHVNYTTNAIKIPKDFHHIQHFIGGISISADTLRYPSLFGQGFPSKIRNNIQKYTESKIPIALNFVVSEENVSDLPLIIPFAKKYGFTGVYLLIFKNPNIKPFFSNRARFLSFFAKMNNEAFNTNIQLGVDCCLYSYLQMEDLCKANVNFIDVAWDGKISGCSYLRIAQQTKCPLRNHINKGKKWRTS